MSTQFFYEIEQNSDEWYDARLGRVTTSKIADVMAKGQGKTRKTYMLKLASERITGEPAETYQNAQMERGHEWEDDARLMYQVINPVYDPKRCGFAWNGCAGSSPDRLIGNDGMLEVKTKAPHLLAEWILADQFPAMHAKQCMGQLWVCEREWVDLIGYWPSMPLFTARLYRDEAMIANISDAVAVFNVELDEMEAQLRQYGGSNWIEAGRK
jgi:hypothetical protein